MNTCNETFKKSIGKDKLYHFGVAFALTILFPPLAIILSLFKECIDAQDEYNHFCWYDLLFDSLGIMAGTTIWLFLWLYL